MNGQNRDVKVGAKVKIVLKADQRIGRLTDGIVAKLLTKSSFHPLSRIITLPPRLHCPGCHTGGL